MGEKRTSSARRIVQYVLVAAILYAGFDIFWPLHRDLRAFDPVALGDLETAMWRSYYDRQPTKLFFELGEMLRTQYKFPFLRSYLGAYHAARAAFVFKEGKSRADYEKALPSLTDYFEEIHRTGDIDFDVRRASTLELEWWIVHRDRTQYPPDALGRACAQAAAAIYRISPDSTLEHGRLRAAAMVIRDSCQAIGGVREEDWKAIDGLLQACYRSLNRAVVQPL